jgi:hypothetical protein
VVFRRVEEIEQEDQIPIQTPEVSVLKRTNVESGCSDIAKFRRLRIIDVVASKMSDEHDLYGCEENERMVAFKPRVTPESSPEPHYQPSKRDAYLIRTSFPNHPEVARIAEYILPGVDWGDDSDVESMEVADLNEKLAMQMAEA